MDRLRALDERLILLAGPIKVLSTLEWPPRLEDAFLADGRLPEPPRVNIDLSEVRRGLDALQAELDRTDPLEAFLHRTARSYAVAAEMLENAHTPAFTVASRELFGAPEDRIHDGAPTHLTAAEHFVERSVCHGLPEPPETMDAEALAARLREALVGRFEPPLPVELDAGLSSKAAAGSRRVAVRPTARFAEPEFHQLLQHEALVHSATKRNGKAQPVLRSLGLSAPRTTCTQEGLATTAELITDTMDLSRLRRIALRIPAVHAALEGADFVELARWFADAGQSPRESYHSARRVFRGGDVRGGVAFTKDVVYLKGLMEVHSFLLEAVQAGRLGLPRVLFGGRMDLGDALALEPAFADGTLTYPDSVPEWVANTACLAAYLTWAAFSDRLCLQQVTLEDFAHPA